MLESVGRRDLSKNLFPLMAELRFYILSELAPCQLSEGTTLWKHRKLDRCNHEFVWK